MLLIPKTVAGQNVWASMRENETAFTHTLTHNRRKIRIRFFFFFIAKSQIAIHNQAQHRMLNIPGMNTHNTKRNEKEEEKKRKKKNKIESEFECVVEPCSLHHSLPVYFLNI